jgi:hypothetical protein
MVIAADYPLLEVIWTMFVFFGFVVWFSLLIRVFDDLFRRTDISGGGKFGWSLFVIVTPLLGALFYLGSRGEAMEERAIAARRSGAEADQAKTQP